MIIVLSHQPLVEPVQLFLIVKLKTTACAPLPGSNKETRFQCAFAVHRVRPGDSGHEPRCACFASYPARLGARCILSTCLTVELTAGGCCASSSLNLGSSMASSARPWPAVISPLRSNPGIFSLSIRSLTELADGCPYLTRTCSNFVLSQMKLIDSILNAPPASI